MFRLEKIFQVDDSVYINIAIFWKGFAVFLSIYIFSILVLLSFYLKQIVCGAACVKVCINTIVLLIHSKKSLAAPSTKRNYMGEIVVNTPPKKGAWCKYVFNTYFKKAPKIIENLISF